MTSIFQEAHEQALFHAGIVNVEETMKWHGKMDCCGFANVVIYLDGRSKNCREILKLDGWSKGWYPKQLIGSINITRTQNLTHKENVCRAYAETFTELTGIPASVTSRMD